MIQRYFIQAGHYQIRVDDVQVDGDVFWCKSEDVDELEAKYAMLVEAHDIAVQALRYIASLYDDSKPSYYQVAYDAYAMRSEAATALERIGEVSHE